MVHLSDAKNVVAAPVVEVDVAAVAISCIPFTLATIFIFVNKF